MRKSPNKTIIKVKNRNKGDESVAGEDKIKNFIDFIMGNNRDFYETFLVKLSEEELEKFMKDNPDFMEEMEKEQKKTAE